MIRTIKILEGYLGDEPSAEGDLKMAAARILFLLSAVDLESEVIPENNFDMLSRLVSSLKNEKLDKWELQLLQEIAGNGKTITRKQ
jgi:hypothetical protein